MNRPLYKELTDTKVDWQDGNTGLWYDKFFDGWDKGFDEIPPEGKKAWIDTVAAESKKRGVEAELAEARARREKLLEAHGQSPLYYKLESDFVTGLGREHPVENGFAWHHTLGTPYLPGSSVKGMVRAWVEGWEGANVEDVRRIFGPNVADIRKNDLEAHVGSVIFLDVLPTEPVQLKADIMTPHYSPYYQDESGQTPPADWHSPIPIPFLVVEQGQTFAFGILPRRKNAKADCKKVEAWLKDALCWTGAGAKTAVGYGRFALDKEAQQKVEEEKRQCLEKQREQEAKQERQRELEAMPPILREMHEDGYETEAFIGNPIQKWLERLQGATGDEKREIAIFLKDWYLAHKADQWEKPNKKNAAKLAPIKAALGEA